MNQAAVHAIQRATIQRRQAGRANTIHMGASADPASNPTTVASTASPIALADSHAASRQMPSMILSAIT